MKWNKTEPVDIGERRVVNKFIWFPKRLLILGTHAYETRWMENAEVVQEYSHTDIDSAAWVDVMWVK